MNKIKVLFIGDTHGDDNSPDKRKDSYLEACLEEMQECVNIADERNCDLVVHLGDVFHRIEPGPLIRNGYLKILSKSKTPWYTVIGNHDVKHNLAYYPQSSIRTLVESGVLITGDSIEPSWQTELMPATTDFSNTDKVEKVVGFLSVADSVHLSGAMDF